MSQRQPNTGSSAPETYSDSPLEAEIELGEEVEIIVDGRRIAAFLSDNVVIFDPKVPGARHAIRTYAYWLASEGDTEAARSLLNQVGRQG